MIKCINEQTSVSTIKVSVIGLFRQFANTGKIIIWRFIKFFNP